METRICAFCDKKFKTRNTGAGRGIYCSVKCFSANKKKKQVLIVCALCGKEKLRSKKRANAPTKYGYKFCSLLCKNRSQGKGKLIEPAHYGTHVSRNKRLSTNGLCLYCNKPLERSCKTYCSSQCCVTYRYCEYISEWKAGTVTGNSCDGQCISANVRNYMLEKAGNKCQKCGWCEINPITNKVPLTINHINGDSNNSSENNLEIICPNCHSLTPTYGSLNKGKGRKWRRNLYKKKSQVL